MKNIYPSLTIGIAARNEGKNISRLLTSLLAMRINSALLESIVVVSDGSHDDTVAKIKSVKSRLVKFIAHDQRQGKAASLNEICTMSESNILVLLDADITIKDPLFIEKLIYPIIKKSADLTSCTVKELPSRTFIGKTLAHSMDLKRSIFAQQNNGENIYTCHGRARAISKKLYKKLNFAPYTADDAYSYLFAKKHGFSYEYVSNTSVYYKIPGTINDHFKQSSRFRASQQQFEEEFGASSIKKEYSIPMTKLVWAFASSLFSKPLQTLSYLVITTLSLVASFQNPQSWGTAYSTK